MENEEIHDGDVVMLKSGGPAMTVRVVSGEEAFCDWFDEKNNKSAKFRSYQLTKPKN